jgi:beta-galactosidase
MSGGPVPALAITGLAAGAASEWGEVVHADTAEVLARFEGGMLDGLPAITRNRSGAGEAWYVATAPDDLVAVVDAVLDGADVAQALPQPVPGVEAVRRGNRLFLLNHTDEPVEVAGRRLEPRGAAVEEG